MTYSNRGNDSFSGGNYPRRDFNDRGSDKPALFDATCARCGSACKVPFRPNGRKEVFCSKCFETNGGGSREFSPRAPRMFDKRDSGGSSFADKPMFSAVCDQCGQNCQVPFRPTNGKPVLCSNCFAGKTGDRSIRPTTSPYSSNAPKDYSRELESINGKLDKILTLLSPAEPITEAKKVAKEITSKILEEIELTSGKKVETGKKKAKVAVKKKSE